MDYNFNFPPPYLCRKNLSDRTIIDKKIQDELLRIKILLRKEIKLGAVINQSIGHIKNIVTPFNEEVPTTKHNDINNQISETKKHISNNALDSQVDKKESASLFQAKSTSEIINNENPTNQKAGMNSSLTIVPNGASTIGYNCTIDYITTYDYAAFGGSYDSLKWYVVFENNGIFYDYKTNGYSINDITTLTKPPFQSKVNFKWTMHFDMYATATYPTSRFIVVMERYTNGNTTPAEVLTTDVVTINFSGTNCINVHDMGLSASHSDGGYPSIKGGDHDSEPTLYVNLNSPAPPDGQTVYLAVTGVSNSNPAAWINSGMEQVTISGGQTHGEWSGFLGSRHVLTTKSIHVKATVNGVDGVATLRITRN
jgi:hypothetical protein